MASSSQTAYNPLLEGEPPVGDGAGSPRVEMLNLIGENIIIDDQDAAVVLVFPRELSTGGTVDPKQIIQDPLGKCKSIFVRPSNPLSSKSLEEGFELLEKDGPVDAALYQSVVREGVSRVLAAAGLTLKSFTGIDGDEIFLKVHAPLDGKMIRKLAQRFKYKVPYMHKLDLNDPSQRASSLTATKEMRGRAQSKPHAHPLLLHQKTMDMFTGVGVPAYIEFDEALDHDELEFRHIDAVRMVLLCIDEWLDLAEMAKQNIITRHFPAAQYDDVQSFNEFWSSLSNVHRPPSHAREDAVRDYFGEKVAFFFHWFCFYCWSLRFLGLAGLLCALRRLPILDLSLQHQRWVQIVFSIALCSWAAVFNETFIRKTGEKKQRWGMMDGDSDSPDRPAYNRNLEGTYCLAFWRLFLQAFVVGFCCLYALWLLIFETMSRSDVCGPGVEKFRRPVLILSIKGGGFIWAKMAPWLVSMQNHRTEERYDTSLTRTLSTVKLFIALFPFINIAFLKAHLVPICPPPGSDRFEDAVWQVYGPAKWPKGIPIDVPMKSHNDTPVVGALDFLNGYTTKNDFGQKCLQGCHPTVCQDGQLCVTNCTEVLEYNLLTVYIFHLLASIVFVAIPIIFIRVMVREQVILVADPDAASRFKWLPSPLGEAARLCYHKWCSKRKQGGTDDKDGPQQDPAEDGVAKTGYTFMQFQSKCCEQAKYEYASWGGSYAEDFMELAVGFALLTSFGIYLPVMTFLAFLSHTLEYRLIAYRMTNVTCRPIPECANGIGAWQDVFETISEVAIIINVASAVFVMHPMRSWPFDVQLTTFLVLEHGLIIARRAIKGMISADPSDLQRIEDINVHLTNLLLQNVMSEKYAPAILGPGKRQDTKTIDLSLGPSASTIMLVEAG